ncbi:MAG: LysM peptidoglycan-binding domain-containing protein [Myxococcota bacterium]|nr:LysM peptidoglycan-binding domain-containing protein [Myxococcota bacterium]
MRNTIILISLFTGCTQGDISSEPTLDSPVPSATLGSPDTPSFEEALARLDDTTASGEAKPVEIEGDGEALLSTEGPEDQIDQDGMESNCGPELATVTIRHGENLSLLAGWTGVPAEEIALYSSVHVQDVLYAGQELLIPLSEESASSFESSRNQFEDRRLDRWLERHGGLLAVTPVSVGTGETVSSMAKDNGSLPIWVVAAFNRGRDLDRLGIGDEVYVPVVGSLLDMPGTEDPVDVPELESVASVSATEAGSGQP